MGQTPNPRAEILRVRNNLILDQEFTIAPNQGLQVFTANTAMTVNRLLNVQTVKHFRQA